MARHSMKADKYDLEYLQEILLSAFDAMKKGQHIIGRSRPDLSRTRLARHLNDAQDSLEAAADEINSFWEELREQSRRRERAR